MWVAGVQERAPTVVCTGHNSAATALMRFLNQAWSNKVRGKLDRFKNEQISLHNGAQSPGICSAWVWRLLAPHVSRQTGNTSS